MADKLANDELGEEQLDLIADASNRSNGAAATDHDFIADIASTDPDRGRAIKDEWLANQATSQGTQTEHDRQRALRRRQSFHSKKTGLGVNLLEGDSITAKAIEEAIRARSKEIFRRDGGRDLASSAHPRTRAQREYDAAYELICGVTTHPDGTHITDTNRSSTNAGRPRVVVTMTLDEFIGNDPASVARQIGLGVIPHSVLADYAQHGDIIAALFDRHGEPLWLSRAQRDPSPAQYLALVLRDRCCVLCSADASTCDVHHRIPWNAPAKGKTDLDDLVLLCRRCHIKLHTDQHTLIRDQTTRRWHQRPAHPHEIPPPQPNHPPPQQE